MSASIEQRNQDATAYVGNLDDRVTEELLWELMLQGGHVINVHIPRDKITSSHQGYGFVEFRTEEDADYTIKILNMIQLYGKHIRVNKASQDKKHLDIGANLFLGNLDPDVDEKLVYDTFSAFGGISSTPKIMRDVDSTMSKGFGFIGFDSFEASDLAIECMNGQYLCNRQIVVQYAYKKDSGGERHGSQAERLLASSNPNTLKPHTRFAALPGNKNMLPGRTMLPPPPPMGNMQRMMPGHHNSNQQGGHMIPNGSHNPMMGMQHIPPPPPPPPLMASYLVPPPMIPTGGSSIPPPPPPPPGLM